MPTGPRFQREPLVSTVDSAVSTDEEPLREDTDADLLRAVTGEPTTYDLLTRIIQLLERIAETQDEALGRNRGPQISNPAVTPPRGPYSGGRVTTPAQLPPNNSGIWQAIDFYDRTFNPFTPSNTLALQQLARDAARDTGDRMGLDEPDNGCPI